MKREPSYEELKKRVMELEARVHGQTRFEDISHAFFQISSSLDRTSSLNGLYRSIHMALGSIIDTTNFFISIYDRPTNSLTFPYFVDSVDQDFPDQLNIDKMESNTARVILTGEPFMVTRGESILKRASTLKNVPDCTPAALWLGVPLRTRNGIIGVMAVQSYTDSECYDQTDMDVMVSVADIVAVTIGLKRSQESLKESESEMSSLVRSAPMGIGAISKGRVIVNVNQHLCTLLGYTRDELLGKSSRIFYSNDEDFARIGREKELQSSNGGTGSVETVFRCKNADPVYVHLSWSYLNHEDPSSGLTFTVLDITERRRANRMLIENEQRYRELFKHMSSGVAIYESPDNGKRFIFKNMNRAGLDFIRKSKEDVLGREPKDVLPGADTVKFVDLLRRVWQTGLPEHCPNRLYKDGTIDLWTKNYVYKLPTGEIVSIFDNITAQVEAEETRAKFEKRMQQAQRMESIGNLAGGIAHDFNNILFPVVGFTEMLLEDVGRDSPMWDSLNEIYTGALRARDLVTQILTFSRQDKNELRQMILQPVIEEALKLIRATIPTTIGIRQNLGQCGPVEADPIQIHQIIMNLATNAYHAMETTGGELIVSLGEVALGEYDLITPEMKPGDYACITVKDTGEGMDKITTGKIFEPFFTTKLQGKGTGMGLSVVHGIIKKAGGSIHVYSEPEKGTEFHVYLPLVTIGAPPDEGLGLVGQPIQKNCTGQILLVDDESSIISMEKRMLERLGYKVTSYDGSVEALAAFKKNPQKFDLVITDLSMPNMPGDELAAWLISIRPDIPILLCTGFSDSRSEEEVALMGVRGFLMKPIVMKELAEKIADILDRS